MHQRLRVAVEALTRDLMQAGAGLAPLIAAPVMPYRVGARDNDPDLGVFYRSDAISVLYVPAGESTVVSHTYYAKNDDGAGTFQLMQYDGTSTDLPVVDHVVGLRFDYFGDGPVPLDPVILQDGPWTPDEPGAPMFDADLLQIRRIRVSPARSGVRSIPCAGRRASCLRTPARPLLPSDISRTSRCRSTSRFEMGFAVLSSESCPCSFP